MTVVYSLEARGLTVCRADRPILQSVNAGFLPGTWTAIVGPNGAGKSTLLSALAGLIASASGGVQLKNRDLADWSIRDRARQMAWLGHTTHTDGDLSAREIVRLGRLPRYGLFGNATLEDERAVDAALAETEATAFAERRLRELSGGERQRVLLARAFAAYAEVLLLDEPTVHLDAPHQRRLIQSLMTRARHGVCVVSVLHDLTLALGADRVIVLAHGTIHADAPPSEPGLQAALIDVFEHAFTIETIGTQTGERRVAVPTV